MIKQLMMTGALVGAIAIPLTSSAATYLFTDVNGNVGSVNANNSTDALIAIQNINPNSGVMLATNGFVTLMPWLASSTTDSNGSGTFVASATTSPSQVDSNGDVVTGTATTSVAAQLAADPDSAYLRMLNDEMNASSSTSVTSTSTGADGTMIITNSATPEGFSYNSNGTAMNGYLGY
jgi:hypothetical protein